MFFLIFDLFTLEKLLARHTRLIPWIEDFENLIPWIEDFENLIPWIEDFGQLDPCFWNRVGVRRS